MKDITAEMARQISDLNALSEESIREFVDNLNIRIYNEANKGMTYLNPWVCLAEDVVFPSEQQKQRIREHFLKLGFTWSQVHPKDGPESYEEIKW